MNNYLKYRIEIGFFLSQFHFLFFENKVKEKKIKYYRSNYEVVWV